MKKVKLLIACISFIVLSCTKENIVVPQQDGVSNQRIKSNSNDNVIYKYDGYVCYTGYCTGTKCRLGSGNTCYPPSPCECVGNKYPNLTNEEINKILKSLPIEVNNDDI